MKKHGLSDPSLNFWTLYLSQVRCPDCMEALAERLYKDQTEVEVEISRTSWDILKILEASWHVKSESLQHFANINGCSDVLKWFCMCLTSLAPSLKWALSFLAVIIARYRENVLRGTFYGNNLFFILIYCLLDFWFRVQSCSFFLHDCLQFRIIQCQCWSTS